MRELLKYNIVITSLNTLWSQYQSCTGYDDYFDAAHVSGVEEADREFPVAPEELYSPLYSPVYERLGKNISVLIVDESHDYKNENYILNAAIRALKYTHAFLLTGTPSYNGWEDFAGQAEILPGSPFINLHHFRNQASVRPGRSTRPI